MIHHGYTHTMAACVMHVWFLCCCYIHRIHPFFTWFFLQFYSFVVVYFLFRSKEREEVTFDITKFFSQFFSWVCVGFVLYITQQMVTGNRKKIREMKLYIECCETEKWTGERECVCVWMKRAAKSNRKSHILTYLIDFDFLFQVKIALLYFLFLSFSSQTLFLASLSCLRFMHFPVILDLNESILVFQFSSPFFFFFFSHMWCSIFKHSDAWWFLCCVIVTTKCHLSFILCMIHQHDSIQFIRFLIFDSKIHFYQS